MMEDIYKDIIDLPHHTSKRHPRMSMYNRAAQFSPFAALTGHDAAIREVARITDELVQDESAMTELERKFLLLSSKLDEQPVISITYFKKDALKKGGSYITAEGVIRKINEYEQTLFLDNGAIISLSSITDIDSEQIDFGNFY